MSASAATTIYRLHSARFTATDTTGSFLMDGRWHTRGNRVLYAAEHVSLALLETLVHAGGTEMPPRALARIRIPASVKIETAAWQEKPHSMTFGDKWIASLRTAVLRVPSIAVNKMEHNFLLNPQHSDFGKIQFESSIPFPLDPRLIPAL